jgi:hypothetical protein
VARGRDRRFLVDLGLDAVAVDPGGGAVDDAVDLGAGGRLEHVESAAGIDLLGQDRVGEDVADVGHGGEVDDRVAVAHRQVEVGRVGDRAGEGLDLERRVVRRGAEVEDARGHPAVEQAIDHVGADEAPASGYQDPHETPFVLLSVALIVTGDLAPSFRTQASSLDRAASRLSGR